MEYFSNLDFEAIIKGAISAVLIIGAAFLIWLVVCRALNLLEKRSKLSKTLLLPIRLVLRYGIVVITLLLVISAFGIPIGNFWTFVSTLLGLIAIGFVAVWSMLSNVSATFLLLMFQPFRVGDYVRVVGEETKGVVTDINFIFTTLRTLKGDIYTVPNNMFFQKAVLRPIDREAQEKEPDEDASKEQAAPDHSQQNLEGIKFPSPSRGPR